MHKNEFDLISERASATHDLLRSISDLSDKIDENWDKAKQEAVEQKRIERLRFWITFAITLIGSLAAVGSLIATIVLN